MKGKFLKILSVLACLTLSAGVAACGGNGGDNNGESSSSGSSSLSEVSSSMEESSSEEVVEDSSSEVVDDSSEVVEDSSEVGRDEELVGEQVDAESWANALTTAANTTNATIEFSMELEQQDSIGEFFGKSDAVGVIQIADEKVYKFESCNNSVRFEIDSTVQEFNENGVQECVKRKTTRLE